MRKILVLIIGIIISSCSKEKDDNVIVINVEGLEEDKSETIKFYDFKNKVLDSINITKSGVYRFKPTWEEPQIITIREDHVRECIDFISRKNNVNINLELSSNTTNTVVDFSKSSVVYKAKTPEVVLYEIYKHRLKSFEKQSQEFNKKWEEFLKVNTTQKAIEANRKPYDSIYDVISNARNNYLSNYLKSESNVISQYLALTSMKFSYDLEGLKNILNRTPVMLQNTIYYRELLNRKSILEKLQIGAVAPNIKSKTIDGKDIDLYSTRGSYVLLDFWASWCGSCRVEMPFVLKAYDKFKAKGLKVVCVSLDFSGKKKSWLKAIKDDKLEKFTHMSLLKAWKDPVAVDYNLRGIPSTYLLSPDGKILAKNDELREHKLEKTLSKFIK